MEALPVVLGVAVVLGSLLWWSRRKDSSPVRTKSLDKVEIPRFTRQDLLTVSCL